MKKAKQSPSSLIQSKLGKFEAKKINVPSSVKAGTGNLGMFDSTYTVTSTGYTAGDDSDFHSES